MKQHAMVPGPRSWSADGIERSLRWPCTQRLKAQLEVQCPKSVDGTRSYNLHCVAFRSQPCNAQAGGSSMGEARLPRPIAERWFVGVEDPALAKAG